MAANIYYSAEFVVSFEKLKKGVVESQAALAKLEGELKKSGDKAGREVFGKIGDEADKATTKIDGLGKKIKKSNEENTKSGETFFSAFKKGWKDSTDVAGGEAVKLGKLVGSVISPMTLAITAATAAFTFIGKKAKEAYENWKKHNENVKKAKDLYAALNGELSGTAGQEREIKAELDKIRDERELQFKLDTYAMELDEESYRIMKESFDLDTKRMQQTKEAQLREKMGFEASAKATDALTTARDEYVRKIRIAEGQQRELLIDNLGFQEKKRDAEIDYINMLIEEQAKLNLLNHEENVSSREIQKTINERRAELEKINKEIEEITKKEEAGTRELTDQEKIVKAREAAEERYKETIAKINADREAGILTEQAANDARNGAMAAWKDTLQGIVDEYNLTSGYTVDLLNEKRAIVGETEKERRLAEATKQLYEDTVDINEQIKKQKIDQNRAEAEIADTEEEKNRLLDEAIRLETDLLEAQRAREKQAYQESDAYKLMLEKDKDAADRWEDAFDAATEGMKQSLVELKKEMKYGFDFDGLVKNISMGLSHFEGAASSVLSITQVMANDQITVIENLLEQQQELIDAQYEATMERLEEERQAALEAAGFVQAITEEGLEAAMAAAVGSGDEAIIYREKRRQEELAINKKYDKLEADAEKKKNNDLKAAEEKAAQEIAEIEYRQAMADWTIKLAMAPAQIASAILEGYAQLGPILGSGAAVIMGVIGALQLAAIIAAMPKKPALAGGGVVGLPQTYTGGYADGGIVMANTPRGVDAVDAVLANREMVLNDDQQANLFNMIAAGQMGGGVQTIIVQLVVDGETWAERMVDLINNGTTSPINARMIEG
jgi:hypothetical protein